MRTVMASALCTILTAATALGQSNTISATGYATVEFDPDWAQLTVPINIKGEYNSDRVLARVIRRCDSVASVVQSVCDTSATIWYSQMQPWYLQRKRGHKVIGNTRSVVFILRDLSLLGALENALAIIGIPKPEAGSVGLHSDTAALKFVITRAAEHARVQAEAALAPLESKLGTLVEIKANPPQPDIIRSTCGGPSAEEIVLRHYGYSGPPIAGSRLPKVRLRGVVAAVWVLE